MVGHAAERFLELYHRPRDSASAYLTERLSLFQAVPGVNFTAEMPSQDRVICRPREVPMRFRWITILVGSLALALAACAATSAQTAVVALPNGFYPQPDLQEADRAGETRRPRGPARADRRLRGVLDHRRGR